MFVHIAAGLLSVVFGTISLVAKPKGSKLHRAAGRAFMALFLVLALTAGLLLIFRWNSFFFGLSVLSFYLAFSGWRVLKRKQWGIQPEASIAPGDWIAALATVVTGIGAVVFYVRGWFGSQSDQAAVVLGALSFAAVAALYDLWRFAAPEALPRLMPRLAKQAWLLEHLGKQAGAFIALLCAFSGTVLSDTAIKPALAQTAPAIVGTPLLLYVTVRYRQKISATKTS